MTTLAEMHRRDARRAGLEAENGRLRDALSQALRQWRMYAEQESDRDLSKDTDAEAILYRELASSLTSPVDGAAS